MEYYLRKELMGLKMSEESSEFDQQIERKNREIREELEERYGEEE